jgi:4-oxalocrotonate tautomerase family enzyme
MEAAMPVITVQMHQTSPDQKVELIRGLTAAAAAVTQLPAASFIVLLQELEDGSIGIGGRTRTEVMAAR